MSAAQYCVILVYSTSHAIFIERILQKADLTCKLVPVPRQLSSDCGVCVRFFNADRCRVEQVLGSSNMEWVSIQMI